MLNFSQLFANPSASKTSKGLSGSETLQSTNGQWYQLKYSTRHKKKLPEIVKARLKGKGLVGGTLDHENIGELIVGDAAKSMESIFSDNTKLVSPNIDFVGINASEDKRKKAGVKIASAFIPNFKDLAGVFKDKVKDTDNELRQKEVRYLKVNFNSSEHKIIKEKKNKKGKIQCSVELGGADLPTTVQKGISDGIAMNALFGNADVNAGGNMGVQYNTNTNELENAAILDFGHGFNNLIHGSKRFGGGVKGDNGILDFLNRDKVLKAPSGSQSKLWRDYEGLIPSQMFVESLRKISSNQAQEKMKEGMETSKLKLKELVNEYKDEKVDLGMIEDSLQRLNRNTGNGKVKYNNVDELIDNTMKNLEQYASNRMEQAKEVAKIMEIQVQIDKHLNKEGKDAELPQSIKEKFNQVFQKGTQVAIDWVKTDAKNPAKHCSLEQYFEARKEELKNIQNKVSIKKTGKNLNPLTWVKKIMKERKARSASKQNSLSKGG